MTDAEKIEAAKNFCIKAHDSINQKRKYTNDAYWVHPLRVANMVKKYWGINDFCYSSTICAAYLHDVLEDVAPHNPVFNHARIEKEFGACVLYIVKELTDVTTLADGNRAIRKEIERNRYNHSSTPSKLIKLCDLYDNICDIGKHDHKFFKVFSKEAELLIPILLKDGPYFFNDIANKIYKKITEYND